MRPLLSLTLLLLAIPALASPQAPDPATSRLSCIECHRDMTPAIQRGWEESAHARAGVGCAACHGKDHSTIFSHKGQVSAGVCGDCHPQQVDQFSRSLHAMAVDIMERDPKFQALSPAMQKLGCGTCHAIGRKWTDGSVGECNQCHSGHRFSLEEARSPEACATCHSGPDHAHDEMWRASRHGQLYASPETRAFAPTCVACHMFQGDHDTSKGLTLGNVANGAALAGEEPPVPMRTLSRTAQRRERKHMVQTCLPCHSSRFATESLEDADQVKREADALLAEAVGILEGLYRDGLLERLPEAGAHGLILGGDQRYDTLSPAEQRFFDLYKLHHASTFKGAYHHSPEYTHNEGWLRMRQDLTFLRHEAARLRKADR